MSPRLQASNPLPGLTELTLLVALGLAVPLVSVGLAFALPAETAGAVEALQPPAGRTLEQARALSVGCLSCHEGIEPMHASAAVKLACTDCHGGDGLATTEDAAHVAPRHPERWPGSANPERSYTALLDESWEFVRFVNPGDLRVAATTCGPCHPEQVDAVPKSPMTTSAIFWTAAAYANGIAGSKIAFLGESYGEDGEAQQLVQTPPPTPAEQARGALPGLLPLPRWEATQPGEYFRAFERGGILQPAIFPEIGNPLPLEDPGRPDIRFSNRGPGTGLRISPALINLHKTRLNDPHLSFLGTNDHPGDFRSSGCTACHVVYANDRDPAHSGPWAEHGHLGTTATDDPTIPRGESGHPIRHRLTRAIPTSQCMSCHMHQPNAFVNTYLGYTMWDYETDGELLWPEEQRDPTPLERRASLDHNPEGAAVRGLWSDREFLAGVSELNDQTRHTRFADYHGHGWVFRAVYSRDREGNLLDGEGRVVPWDDPERLDKAVHLKDIHLERGMHCVDCHFSQDVHGDGLIHGEYASALEINCEDCHGTVEARTDLRTSGPASAAAPGGEGTDLRLGTTPFGERRFVWQDGVLLQRSMVTEGLEWQVTQVADSVNSEHDGYNPRAARAKTIRRAGTEFLAHGGGNLSCATCHTSWTTSCFGCHLPQEANQRSDSLHYEGQTARNYASYNPQVIRTDVFMLGNQGIYERTDAPDTGTLAPVRSSSALVLSSTNQNRQRVYVQQPPISTPGFASQAFNPHVPHTVRLRETRKCSDCHLSDQNDNNAWLAQTFTLGTGFVDFVGFHAWVGLGEKGLEAVQVTEWEEPQAVLGSFLHRLAYPRHHAEHQARDGELAVAHHHHGARHPDSEVLSLQLRGEYLFAALGGAGFGVFDVANVANKDFSERIVTAPVSPLGQQTFVDTAYATQVALPTTMPVAPREPGEIDPANLESPLHPIYRYAVVSDLEEGLVLVDVTTLVDRDPTNNFLRRATLADGSDRFDAGGRLAGARSVTLAGTWAYVGCDAGLAVVDLADPLSPRLAAVLADVPAPRKTVVQLRYLFAAGPGGLSVVDVTDPEEPRLAARVEMDDARSLHVARTWAYVAAGADGLALVDVTRPEEPRLDRLWTADGRLDDVHDVVVGATNASLFAYVASGKSGLHVVQLTSPDTVPGYLGFSPRPEPVWIAGRHTHGPALALSRGLQRDRAVDETGHQVAVFNRLGSGPLTFEQMRGLLLRDGEIYTVRDELPDDPDDDPGASP